MSVGLLNCFAVDIPTTNRCPMESPYSFRNKTFCCSRPVDFQWDKSNGYCYGKSHRCIHNEGCETCKFQMWFVYN